MASSYQTYTGNGITRQFAVTLTGGPPLRKEHIRVYVNGNLETFGSGYTVADDMSSVTFALASTPAAGATIRFIRVTPSNAANRVVDFAPGASLSSKDLDEATLNALYAAQETADKNVLTFDPLTGVVNGGGVTVTNVSFDFGNV